MIKWHLKHQNLFNTLSYKRSQFDIQTNPYTYKIRDKHYSPSINRVKRTLNRFRMNINECRRWKASVEIFQKSVTPRRSAVSNIVSSYWNWWLRSCCSPSSPGWIRTSDCLTYASFTRRQNDEPVIEGLRQDWTTYYASENNIKYVKHVYILTHFTVVLWNLESNATLSMKAVQF